MALLFISNIMIFTSKYFTDAENNICSKEEFQCLDGFCIDKKLKCNQEINCRDNSDESALNAGCEG